MNENLKKALEDLAEAIKSVALGRAENLVILDAGLSLIESWNEFNEDYIDDDESNIWLDKWYKSGFKCDKH